MAAKEDPSSDYLVYLHKNKLNNKDIKFNRIALIENYLIQI